MSAQDLGQYIPAVRQNGIRLHASEPLVVATGGTVTLPATTTIGGSSVSALGTITSTSANAFTVGANGLTNPQLNIDGSTASAATGINIKGAAAAGGVAISVLSSGTNESLTLDAKGSGTVTINGTATGGVTLGRATTVTTGDVTITNGSLVVSANAKGISFTGTGTNGGVITNPYNDTASALSGTQKDIKILIGATPYYFTVYPTKA